MHIAAAERSRTIKEEIDADKSGRIPNLSNDPVFLGQLYTAEHNILVDASLWNQTTIKKHTKKHNSGSSQTKTVHGEDIMDRMSNFDLSVSLEMDFMNGS